MESYIKILLICLAVTACNRDNPPAPVTTPKEQALSETIKTTDALRLDGLNLTYRTGNRQAYILAGFDFVPPDSVKEVGFCLSDSDSLLSVLNSAQQRISIPSANRDQSIFWAELPALQANRKYYIDSYVIFPSGRVFYGHNNASPSVSRQPQIGVSSFVLPTTDTTTHSSLQVVRKAALPVPTATGFSASFSINNNLYVLGGDGSLFLYDPVGNQWEQKQSLKTRTQGIEMNTHFNGFYPIAFPVNGNEYVYFTADGIGELAKNLWSYNPVADKWTFITDQFNIALPGSEPAYTSGDQAYLYNSSQNKVFGFSSVDAGFRVASQIQLPAYSLRFVPGSSQPLAYRSKGEGTVIGRYDLTSGILADAQPLLPLQTNIAIPQHVITSIGKDVLLGSGENTLISRDQNPALTVTELNDGLVRYSTITNKITASYSLKTLNDAYWNRQVHPEKTADRDGVFHYATLLAGGHVYVIDSFQGSLTELVF